MYNRIFYYYTSKSKVNEKPLETANEYCNINNLILNHILYSFGRNNAIGISLLEFFMTSYGYLNKSSFFLYIKLNSNIRKLGVGKIVVYLLILHLL